MAWMDYICMVFSISVLFTVANGNVLRLDKTMNGIILSSDTDTDDINLLDDNTVKKLDSYINLDDSPSLRLKDPKTLSIGSVHQHSHITSVRHFARHGLCRNIYGKVRFYTALKYKFCHTESKFIAQMVEDLCTEKGRLLHSWVAELFDTNEDGNIDHFEKLFYDE
ncbi:uncharacterized protein LOC123538738 [Mercenaria mercenaria]|uniref:uncharacterized protein LOC123538738 n=1 Tax=Mercenaria mercenaria TaxID=6596 RepID=UPI00234F807D|nr:uncharacterized protein LOC123538738 [Mercenaria mercenaria]